MLTNRNWLQFTAMVVVVVPLGSLLRFYVQGKTIEPTNVLFGIGFLLAFTAATLAPLPLVDRAVASVRPSLRQWAGMAIAAPLVAALWFFVFWSFSHIKVWLLA
jgi:hypothetical protein